MTTENSGSAGDPADPPHICMIL